MLSPMEKHQLETYCQENPELAKIVERLELSHRMEISQISHEIRNPVTLLNSYLQLTQTYYPQVRTFSTWKPLVENMYYLKQLLEELSLYNNSQTLTKSCISLYELLSTLQKDYQSLYPDIPIILHKLTHIPTGYFDKTKLQSVFTNIIRNAIEAPKGSSDKEIHIFIKYNSKFCITICNNGLPIPAHYLSTLFDPFITHKADGTGLGLAIAQNIISAHNGTINVSSTNKKTCFMMRLPLFQE